MIKRNFSHSHSKTKFLSQLSFLINILLYIYLILTLGHLNSINLPFVHISNLYIDRTALSCFLTQLQVILLVCFVVLYDTKGYYIALTLCTTTIGFDLVSLLINRHGASFIDTIMIFCTLFIIIIIYNYGRRLKRQILKTNKQKEKLHQLAFYDALTGLPNRRLFMETLEYLTIHPQLYSFSVAFIDLDNFKKINDTIGHQEGDKLLQYITQIFTPLTHPDDLLCRLGGDEFALIIPRHLSQAEVASYLHDLRNALVDKIYLDTKHMHISASFGVAFYPQDANQLDALLKYADTAMYVAKGKGKNAIEFFTPVMHDDLIHKLHLENNLREALAQDEFQLAYQPQFETQTKKLRGAEVLLRWHSIDLGSISPDQFIPIAEETGLILPIGKWVLEKACSNFKHFITHYGDHFILSINISVAQFLAPNFLELVQEVIKATEFDPHYLEFEITESIFISSKDDIIDILNQLKEMGIQIALDDFGTSYASLSYIQALPLDIIKIDKSFIQHLLDPAHQKEQKLVSFIIQVAQQLGYKVIAEGIEELSQLEFLKAKHCDYIQGYLWSKPLSEQDFIALLQSLNTSISDEVS